MALLDSTLGAVYVGNIASAVLYGITIVQTFIFFRSCGRDRLLLKMIVFTLWVLDTLHLILVSQALYYYSVTTYGNFLALLKPTRSSVIIIFVASISDLLCKYVFGRRVWQLSGHSRLLAISITGLTLYSFGTGIAFGIKEYQLDVFSKSGTFSWLLYSGLAVGVVDDALITTSLCVLLLRSRTGFKRADSLMNVLMLYSINTSLISGLGAAVCFITYALMPNNYYYMGVFFVLSKLQINCLLASLNARSPLRKQMGLGSHEKTPSRARLLPNDNGAGRMSAKSKLQPLTIRIDTTTRRHADIMRPLPTYTPTSFGSSYESSPV